jgi:hypothetical protein
VFLRNMLANPELMRQMMTPQNIQAAAALQSAMQQMQGGAAQGAPGAVPAAGGQAGNVAPMDLSALMGMFGGSGFGLGSPAPLADPATAYAAQLQQLKVRWTGLRLWCMGASCTARSGGRRW